MSMVKLKKKGGTQEIEVPVAFYNIAKNSAVLKEFEKVEIEISPKTKDLLNDQKESTTGAEPTGAKPVSRGRKKATATSEGENN